MKVLILAGGSGSRLFPLSRSKFPKQFLKITGNLSLLQNTIKRFKRIAREEDFIIITNKDYEFLVKNQLNEIGLDETKFHILYEPVSRNTAPSIALGLKYIQDELKSSLDEMIFVSPSDHYLNPESILIESIEEGKKYASLGHIITFGIKPSKPETGYGYIEIDPSSQFKNAFNIKKFHEKPDLKTAKKYLSSGNFFWNSGMFLFRMDTIILEFETHSPDIYKHWERYNFNQLLEKFNLLPEISFDYAIMEKTQRGMVIPLEVTWSDIGSWDSVYELLKKDRFGNVSKGNVVSLNTKNSLIFGDKRLISTISLEELLVIETEDAILIAKKGESQKVKELVERLKKDKKRKPITEYHKTVYRPWGKYTELDKGERYRIKKITVQPGEALSLQMHYHRSEHWVVVKGTAKVILEDKDGNLREYFVHENESIYVPKSTRHRLINPGKIPLEIIEVQVGEYIEEDDIIRFEDIYGRDR